MKGKFKYRGSYFSYAITYFMYYFAMGTMVNMMSIYLTSGLGKSDQEMTFITSAASLFGIIANPIIGYLNDKFRKPRIMASSLLFVAATCALIFSFSKNTFVLYILNGAISGFIGAVSPIGERVASSGKYRYGQIRIWGTIGFAAAPPIAGAIFDFAESYWVFIMVAVVLVIAAVSYLLLTGIRFYSTDDEAAQKMEESKVNRLAFLKNPMFILFVCIAMLYSGCAGLNNAYSPILLQNLGLSTSLVGTVISISVMVELPIVLFSNVYMDRFSCKSLAAMSVALMMLQFVFYSFCKNLIVVLVALILLKAVCGTLFMMVQLKLIRGVVGADSVSPAQGSMNATTSLAAIAIQNAVGWLAGTYGIQPLYIVLSVMAAVALVLSLFLKVDNTKKFFS